MSDDELADALASFEALDEELHVVGPQNPDQLHAWIEEEIGIDIPRTKVCEDHDAPFWVLADLFFEERFEWTEPDGSKRWYGPVNGVSSTLVMANRSGGKTFLIALLHYISAKFKPGYEGLSFGANEEQGKRCYDHLSSWVFEIKEVKPGEFRKVPKEGIKFSQKSITEWVSGSKVEVLRSGTPEQVNGPHPHVAHADEVELMRTDTFDESRNMPVAGKTTDGRMIMPKNILTSTRKSMFGRMQQLIDEIREAESTGMIPPYNFKQYCVFETAAQVPNCRSAPENAGKPDEELCNCHLIPKGVWDDGTQRTLEGVCDGRFYKSRGWQPKAQIDETFRQNVRPVWEAQQECRRPETANNYVQWSDSVNAIKDYDPDPSFGKIYTGIDWGAGNPNAVVLFQVINTDLEVIDYHNQWKIIPSGSWVCFDEIYEAEIGAGKLAQKTIAMERKWRAMHPSFRVEGRFADPQGRQQRHDFLDAGLVTRWNATRDFEYHVTLVQDLFEEGKFYADVGSCPMFCNEIQVWRKNPQTGKQIDEFNHAMSGFRYAVANVHRIGQKAAKRGKLRKGFSEKKRKLHSSSGPVGLAGQAKSPVVNEFGS